MIISYILRSLAQSVPQRMKKVSILHRISNIHAFPSYPIQKDCETHYRGEGLPISIIFNYSFISIFIQIKNVITRYCNNKWSDKFPQRDWYF